MSTTPTRVEYSYLTSKRVQITIQRSACTSGTIPAYQLRSEPRISEYPYNVDINFMAVQPIKMGNYQTVTELP